MKTASTEVTSIRRRNDIEKTMRKTHQYFINLKIRTYIKISTLNWCHNFLVDSPFKIHVISTNFPFHESNKKCLQVFLNERLCSLLVIFWDNFRFQLKVYDGCHDLIQKATSFYDLLCFMLKETIIEFIFSSSIKMTLQIY